MKNLNVQLGLSYIRTQRKLSILNLVLSIAKMCYLEMYRPDMVLRGRHKVNMKLTYSNKDLYYEVPII